MKTKRHLISPDTVFVLLLFFVFTVCILSVISAGALIYNNISNSMNERYNDSTPLFYITMKLRSYDRSNGITIESIDNDKIIALHDDDYITYIYCYNGSLRELFISQDSQFTPSDGEIIADCSSLSVNFADSDSINSVNTVLNISYGSSSGKTLSTSVMLRSISSGGEIYET